MISNLSVNKLHFLQPITIFSLKSWQPSPMNMAKIPFKAFPKRKSDTVEDGVRIFLLAGIKRETPTREYKT
jgi:hypothetical protein